jgi:uracil-DNA glycosylase family 4
MGARKMGNGDSLEQVQADVVASRKCPRLVGWREQVAREKRASFQDWEYWGKPVPGFGDPSGRLVIVGLAPAAHGGNRTGRIFTGDRSGDWLFAALYRAGFANQPTSEHRDDGLRLTGAYITAVVHCAPPGNKPTLEERDKCIPYLARELRLLDWRVVVALGAFAHSSVASLLGIRPRPVFGHGSETEVGESKWLLGSYHPSQQNTFTGKLTEPMLDAVFVRARALVSASEVKEDA